MSKKQIDKMIDTIKILIPIKDSRLLETIKRGLTHTSRMDLKTNQLKFEYFTGEIEAGSHSRKINFKLDDLGIFFEFSLPKYFLGNNIEMIRPSEVSVILEKFHQELRQSIGIEIPLVSTWVIYRLDLSYNWTLESKEKCQSIMNFIQRIDFPRKKKYQYDTSVMYRGTLYTVKFYLKGAEFLKHDFKSLLTKDEEKTHHLLNWGHKVLRFEVEFRKGYLETLFKKKKVHVSDILNHEHIEEILESYLSRVFKYINKENMRHEDVRQVINENFRPGKALTLYQFYKGYYYEKDEKYHIIKGLNRSTIYNYKKALRAIGVSFTENIGDGKFVSLEDITIPSDKAFFTFLDYKSGR